MLILLRNSCLRCIFSYISIMKASMISVKEVYYRVFRSHQFFSCIDENSRPMERRTRFLNFSTNSNFQVTLSIIMQYFRKTRQPVLTVSLHTASVSPLAASTHANAIFTPTRGSCRSRIVHGATPVRLRALANSGASNRRLRTIPSQAAHRLSCSLALFLVLLLTFSPLHNAT